MLTYLEVCCNIPKVEITVLFVLCMQIHQNIVQGYIEVMSLIALMIVAYTSLSVTPLSLRFGVPRSLVAE
jgi:hypothetical protein